MGQGQIVGTSTGFGVDAVSGIAVGGGIGVFGKSDTEAGVSAASQSGNGVFATSASGSGVAGSSTSGFGVYGVSGTVSGTTPVAAYGVYGESASNDGVHGVTSSSHAGVSGTNTGSGAGVYGYSQSGPTGQFRGNVTVTGNVTANDVTLVGSDCAEDFDIAGKMRLDPGTVVVFDDEGAVSKSAEPYNKRVAGVISGAGKYRPGVILGREGSSGEGKAPVALMGRVYCKVDATYATISVGERFPKTPFDYKIL
jgi:hypothetical protein